MDAGTRGAKCTSRADNVFKNTKDVEEFKYRIESLKPMERKTDQAFLNRHISKEYKWPVENETKDESNIRKKFNSATLKRAADRKYSCGYRNPEDSELSSQRHNANAARMVNFRNPEDPELNEQRHYAAAAHCRIYRNPENPELNEQRHYADAARMVNFRNPEDTELNQERHEIDAARQRETRLPDQLARAAQTPEQAQERMQRNFEDRTARLKGNKKACNASAIFCGDQIVKEHYIGSFTTNRGGYTNKCQHCNGLRFAGERDSICCQCGKVRLDKLPEPTPILKQLLENKDPRSKVFKKQSYH